MLRIAFAAVLCLCLADASNAKPAPKPEIPNARCLGSTASLLSRIRDMIAGDPAWELRIYTDERAAKVLRAFNDQEPKTDYKADRIMVLSNTDQTDAVMVILMLRGCIVQAGKAPTKQWRAVIESAIGDES